MQKVRSKPVTIPYLQAVKFIVITKVKYSFTERNISILF